MIIPIKIFQYRLLETLSVFMYPILVQGLKVLTGMITIFVIIYSIKYKKIFWENKLWIPSTLSLLSLIFICLPIGDIVEDYRFKDLYDEYTLTAEKALNGEYGDIKDNQKNEIQLPEEYRKLSRNDGKIYVFKNDQGGAVFYFKVNGVLDNFSGYVYLLNSESSHLLDDFGDWKYKSVGKNNWYIYYSN